MYIYINNEPWTRGNYREIYIYISSASNIRDDEVFQKKTKKTSVIDWLYIYIYTHILVVATWVAVTRFTLEYTVIGRRTAARYIIAVVFGGVYYTWDLPWAAITLFVLKKPSIACGSILYIRTNMVPIFARSTFAVHDNDDDYIHRDEIYILLYTIPVHLNRLLITHLFAQSIIQIQFTINIASLLIVVPRSSLNVNLSNSLHFC